jgi:DNA-binding IclR family transcriptional regulator
MSKSSPQQKRRGSSKPNSRRTKHRTAVPVSAGKPAGKVRTQVRTGTKQAALIAMMQKPRGATLADMEAKTSWQPHSIRAALTGLRKRGLAVTRGENNAGVTIYRIPVE